MFLQSKNLSDSKSWILKNFFEHVGLKTVEFFFNPLTTGVENECWLRGMVHLDYNLPNVIWLGFGQVESYLIHTISEKAKNNKGKVRTRADKQWTSTVMALSQIDILMKHDWLL